MERLRYPSAPTVTAVEKEPQLKELHLVRAVIFNDQAQALLIKRGPNQSFDTFLWELPGGKLNEGEDALEALKREVHEETGLEVRVPEQVKMEDNRTMEGGKYDGVNAKTETWVCLTDEYEVNLDVEEVPEHAGAQWCTKAEVEEMYEKGELSITTKQAIENFLLIPTSNS